MKRVIFALLMAILICLALAIVSDHLPDRVTSYDRTQTQRANIATWDAQWNIDLTATAAAQ